MWSIQVCTYNVMLPVIEPIRSNGQARRVEVLPQAIKEMSDTVRGGIDVIVLQEVIPTQYRQQLLSKLALYGWVYTSNPLQTPFMSGNLKLVSGGIVICSKHPILTQHQSIFDTDCQHADCAACKGVLYCRILLPHDNVVNIFGTHFQAWNTQRAYHIRRQQSQQCSDFIQSLNIPEDEPLIFAGDLNTDYYTRHSEVYEMLATLNMKFTKTCEDSHLFTSDPKTNNMVGNDDTMMYATDIFPNGCYHEYINTLSCPCCPRELLDYILFSSMHLQPITSECKVRVLKTKNPITINLNLTTKRSIHDLSDHYPLIGRLSYNQPAPFKNRKITTTMEPYSNKSWVALAVLTVLLTSLIIVIITFFLHKSSL